MFDGRSEGSDVRGRVGLMAIAPLPDWELLDARSVPRPALRLLSFPGEGGRAPVPGAPQPVSSRPSARRTRLRRNGLVVLLVGLLAALAVPVSALGGTSGVPAARIVPGAAYVVQPGDTLASIAQRLAPDANPEPLVAKMASETGSESVVAGEHLVLP